MPSTPPETPLDGYFNPKEISPPPTLSTHISIYPDSPPVTPERHLADEKRESAAVAKGLCKGKDKDKEATTDEALLPTHGPRRPSIAYAHHRRTSTATIIRLAAARRGFVLTPSKVVSLFLIAFSAVYLASFLPGPLNALLHARATTTRSKAPTYYTVPTVSGALNNKPRQRSMPIGETAQRRAWEESFPHRIPPQQHVVPVNKHHDGDNLARSYHGDLYRAHPELLVANTGSQSRRRPLRFGKAAAAAGGDAVVVARQDRRGANSHGNDAAADDLELDDASHSPKQPALAVERQLQLNRMKKMSVATQQRKVGKPLDSSEVTTTTTTTRDERDRAGLRKKVKKVGTTQAEDVEDDHEARARREGASGTKPRTGLKDRREGGAKTVDEWAELEDSN